MSIKDFIFKDESYNLTKNKLIDNLNKILVHYLPNSVEKAATRKFYKYLFLYLFINPSQYEQISKKLIILKDHYYGGNQIELHSLVLKIISYSIEKPSIRININILKNLKDKNEEFDGIFRKHYLTETQYQELDNYIKQVYYSINGVEISDDEKFYYYFNVTIY